MQDSGPGQKLDLKKYRALLDGAYIKKQGRVSQVVGLTVESTGPDMRIGEYCRIKLSKYADELPAEVVGFRGSNILLMPLGDLGSVKPGSIVEASDRPLTIRVGEHLLGRVLDGLGRPIDQKGALGGANNPDQGTEYRVTNPPPDPLSRARISVPLSLGIKVIDGLLTIGRGQRVGIFAGTGVGKSVLLGMIARNTSAEIIVIALIGERGREVREFIEKDLGEDGLKRSVLVVATSDNAALLRLKAAEAATSIAEFFRSQGKNVLLLMDSLTRYSMAQREVGLAVGEPPVSKGYTPSVFAVMPKLLERAGNSDKGSITGLYTVLVDGDDLTEPVSDTARGILDGHIVLSRKIANRNRYPAIDVLASISRCMTDVINDEHKRLAGEIKRLMAVYADAEDLINIGAYVKGSNAEIDEAIDRRAAIDGLLLQGVYDKFTFAETMEIMGNIMK